MYADIIIDISVENLDRTYQYRIPEHMLGTVCAGDRVVIPFGNGNRKIKGYIVGLSDTPKIEEEKIKDIDSICPKNISIDDKMISLAFWMKDHFGSTANDALKCVIPVKRVVKNKVDKTILAAVSKEELIEAAAKAEKRHYAAKVRLLNELILEYDNGLKHSLVTDKLNILNSTISALERDGLIKIESSVVYRNYSGAAIEGAKADTGKVELNDDQKRIAGSIIKDIKEGKNDKYLIHGITGSGKTEVYLAVIDEVIRQGKSVIMLIPEIALTYQTVKRFYKRFGDSISVLNSRMSAGERYDQYLRAKNGDTKIVIGPRSAVFTPFDNLGLIIIDEEHEGSYKSELSPRYNTRDVAFRRAETEGASVILGSATPSLESYSAACAGRIRLFELDKRAGEAELPTVYVTDLREELKAKNRSIFSRKLKELIVDRLEKHEQTMLFINRRGHSGFVNCRSCGHVIKCPHCDVSLTYHNNGKLVCHYCGFERDMVKCCPDCGSPYIMAFGTGTQKVEELLKAEFPSARVLRMDHDTTKQKESYDEILSKFSDHEADILVGTQMIVKGHDFHKVTLVGILLADMSLYSEDFRSAEKTFELLSQAAGRAGRGSAKGDVVIQTYNPEHYAVTTAAAHDYKRFYSEEIEFRRLMNYPPSWNMLKVSILGKEEEPLAKEAERVYKFIKAYIDKKEQAVKIFGPSQEKVFKLNDIFRYAIYLKSDDYDGLVDIKNALGEGTDPQNKEVSIQFDFNPL